MCVEKLYTDNNAQEHLHGNWFYRPNETFHLASRKFLEKVGHQSMNQMFPPKKQNISTKCQDILVQKSVMLINNIALPPNQCCFCHSSGVYENVLICCDYSIFD